MPKNDLEEIGQELVDELHRCITNADKKAKNLQVDVLEFRRQVATTLAATWGWWLSGMLPGESADNFEWGSKMVVEQLMKDARDKANAKGLS